MNEVAQFGLLKAGQFFVRRNDGVTYQKVRQPKSGQFFATHGITGDICVIKDDEVVRIEKAIVRSRSEFSDKQLHFPCSDLAEMEDNVRKAISSTRGNGEVTISVAGATFYASSFPRGTSTTEYLEMLVCSRGWTKEEFLNHEKIKSENSVGETSLNKVIANLIINHNYREAKSIVCEITQNPPKR